MRLSNISIRNWQQKHHGERKQAEVIDFIEPNIEMFSLVASTEHQESSLPPMDAIYKRCATPCKVGKTTLHRWWKSYLHTGELPYQTSQYERKMMNKYKWISNSAQSWNDCAALGHSWKLCWRDVTIIIEFRQELSWQWTKYQPMKNGFSIKDLDRNLQYLFRSELWKLKLLGSICSASIFHGTLGKE